MQTVQTAKKDAYAILALLLMTILLVGAFVAPVAFADGDSSDDDSSDDDSSDDDSSYNGQLGVTCMKASVVEGETKYSYVHPVTGEAISPLFKDAPDTGFGFPPGTILIFPSGATCTSPGFFLLPGWGL